MSKQVRRAIGLEHIELERLRDDVGKLFAALQEAIDTLTPPAPGVWRPPVDLRESQDAIEIVVELPGIAAEAVKVALTNTELRIVGEKRQRVPRRRARAHLCSERTYGRFERTVPLRWTISVREATAELRNGVLTIRLPKATERRGREFRVAVSFVEADE